MNIIRKCRNLYLFRKLRIQSLEFRIYLSLFQHLDFGICVYAEIIQTIIMQILCLHLGSIRLKMRCSERDAQVRNEVLKLVRNSSTVSPTFQLELELGVQILPTFRHHFHINLLCNEGFQL